METIIEDQTNRIIERKSRATQLDNLIQGYRLYARTEGKSPKTIRIITTFETYARTRFIELEKGGKSVNIEELYGRFIPQRYKAQEAIDPRFILHSLERNLFLSSLWQ